MKRSWLRRVPLCAGLVVAVALCAGVVGRADATTTHPANSRPYVRDGQSVPTYSYAHAIHESVSIRTPVDTDHDGRRDRVMLDIIRPDTGPGVTVPVIMDASPYFACCGRGNESETKTYRSDGTIAEMPLFYDNYFVPRGYAVAALDLIGTERSTGCPDVGGRAEVLGAKAAVDWLNGRARGYDLHGNPVTADWTTGAVGMIGKSWDGTVANGVAATGVEGLRTVVALSAISSWYDYFRFDGVLRFRRGVGSLANDVTGRPRSVCGQVIADEQQASDDTTGDVNAFWKQRDYRTHVGHVHAAMFVVHGLNDLNVTTNQFASWWHGLAAHDVPRKLWLSQAGHVDPFDYRRSVWVRTLHQWFDHWLLGLDNGAMSGPRASIERASGRWVTARRWPAGRSGSVALSRWGGARTRTVVDRPRLSERGAVGSPTRAREGRVAFLGPVRTSALHIAGSPSVTLRLQANRPTTELTVRLVDYGRQHRVDYLTYGEGIRTLRTQSCWGQSTAEDDACYRNTKQTFTTSGVDVLTRGWLDAAHRRSLTTPSPLRAHRWYRVTVPLDATDAVVRARHRLGVIVTLSDLGHSSPTARGATVRIDPARSTLHY